MKPEILLSERFAQFSTNVVALHEKKKELIAEFKRLYEENKAALKTLDEEAVALHQDFEKWQREMTASKESIKIPLPQDAH